MTRFMTFVATFFVLGACVADETVSGYALPEAEYHLEEIDGVPFSATATISFPEEGRVVGQAPCNRYFAAQTEFYPWFNVDAIGASRMACPDLDAEAAFFAALEAMTLAEVVDQTLILSTTDGRRMVFVIR